MSNLDPYQILGVPHTASAAEIAHAFSVQARKYQGSDTAAFLQQARQAFDLLSNPATRAQVEAGMAPARKP